MEQLSIENRQFVPMLVKKREFSSVECCFAWLSFLFGFLFCKVFPVSSSPMGGFLFVLFIFFATTVVLKVRKSKFGVEAVIASSSAVIISASLLITSNVYVHMVAYTYAAMAYCYYIFAATGNITKRGFNDFVAVDYCKAIFVAPFIKIENMLAAMFSGRIKKSGDIIGKIIIGVLIAFVPTLVVCILLSYDSGFSEMLDNILSFDIGDVFGNIICLWFGTLIGYYIFGLFISSVDGKCEDICTEEKCCDAANKIRIIHMITVLAAVLPVLFVYVMFFVSQWKYYISAFSGVLPEGFSYSLYAREGFFQLCIVSVINMLIIICVGLFMNDRNTVCAKIKSAINIAYSVFTLILIGTAMSKMVLYIDSYGLTPKRVYSSWLMIVLAMIFVVVIIKQFVKKISIVAISMAIGITMFALLSLTNIEGNIAHYNVERYLEGSLETVDVWSLEELGDAAVPEMVYLMKELESENVIAKQEDAEIIYEDVKKILEDISVQYKDEQRGVMAYTIPYIRAVNALKNADDRT